MTSWKDSTNQEHEKTEKLKTVLELYDLETHQKKLGPDYHRLKTMVKRSIEQEIRNKNFGSRNGNFEKNAVVFFFMKTRMRTSDKLKSKKNCAHSPCAGRLTTWSRGGGGGTLSPQRTRMEVLRHNPQQPDGPTKTRQMHVHWHMQTWTTNGDAMPAVLDRRGCQVQSAPWLWPTDSRRHEPPLTNGLRSQLREQPTGRGRDCPRVLDECAA